MRNKAFLIACCINLASCSLSPKLPKLGREKGALSSDNTTIVPGPKSVLALKSVDIADGAEGFSFEKTTDLAWGAEDELVLSQAGGRSVAYNLKTQTWGSPYTSGENENFTSLFDFRSEGIVALTKDSIVFRRDAPGLMEIKLPSDFDLKNRLSVTAGLLSYKSSGQYRLLRAENASVVAIDPLPPMKEPIAFYPCKKACLFLALNENSFTAYSEEQGWVELGLTFELPDEEKPAKFAVKFSDDSPSVPQCVAILSAKGKIYVSYAGEIEDDRDVPWREVLKLSEQYCLPCHKKGDDGYDRQETWTGLKDDILSRLKAAPEDSALMPKAGSQAAQDLSSRDRERIISWLSKQTATEKDGVGTGSGTDETEISGEFKALVQQHCLSCHAQGAKVSWWKTRQGNAIDQIQMGKMPKGKILDSDTKQKLVDSINNL